jgi:sugar lactone lactonase YvrE
MDTPGTSDTTTRSPHRATHSDWLRLADALHHDNLVGTALSTVAVGLQRPECVLAHASGMLFASDQRGGVTAIRPDGSQRLHGSSDLIPNGIALQADGGFLVANLSPAGGVWRIDPDTRVAPWMTEADRRALPRVNFVMNDRWGRVWACVSATDGGDQYPLNSQTGFIVLRDPAGTRIVCDGLHYTNECRLSADGSFMYVNETFGRRLSRFRVEASGALSDRQTIASFDDGDFPDGLMLDAEGGAWVVCVGSNRIWHIAPDGQKFAVIDDSIPATTQRLEAAFAAGTLNRPMLSAARGHRLANVTSIAFGGADLRTAFLGCLAGETLATFRSPVAGLEPVHWRWPCVTLRTR